MVSKIKKIKKIKKFIVTSALPYANGDVHVGHLLEHIQTDIWVRHLRSSNHEVLSFCADDAHGAPVMMKAEEMGIKPIELIDKVRLDHIASFKKFGIHYTNYHSTHAEENKKLSIEIYKAAKDKGFIYKKEIKQCFDEKKGMFLADRYISGECPKCSALNQYGDGCDSCGSTYSATELINPISSLTNTTPSLKVSEHIFFDLNKAKDELKSFLKSASIQKPIVSKLSEWVDGELKSWNISRDAPYFGFSIPDEKDKFFYVWVDAPIGYLASAKNWASKNNIDIKTLWGKNSEYEIHHFIGKDITYFHGLFWPALLNTSQYKLPDSIHVHGFITVNGQKMSKSKGTFITADQFAKVCDPELLRYYYASKLNSKIEDIDLNLDDLSKKINSDLVGKFSNIFSRSAPFISKNKNFLGENLDNQIFNKSIIKASEVLKLVEIKEFSKALKLIMEIADNTNKYINEKKPWKLDNKEAVIIATTAINIFKNLCILLHPIIPNICSKMLKMLRIKSYEHSQINNKMLNIEINEFNPVISNIKSLNIQQFIVE